MTETSEDHRPDRRILERASGILIGVPAAIYVFTKAVSAPDSSELIPQVAYIGEGVGFGIGGGLVVAGVVAAIKYRRQHRSASRIEY